MLKVLDLISPMEMATEATGVSGTLCKIMNFAKIPAGWAYGRGSCIHQGVIEQAINLNAFLSVLDFEETDAFPAENGDIEIAAYKGDTSLYIHLDGESYSLRKEEGDQETLCEPTADATNAYYRIVETAKRCASFASQAPSILSQEKTGFADWHLQSLPATMQHLSFSANAFEPLIWESVNTSNNTMKIMSLATLPSLPSSIPINFQQGTFLGNQPVEAETLATG